ncbi:hypothetical protein J1605_006605 [Eschrichtius robustus]|uniref:Branched-chain-amino-acid aminotransferase, mitochondrial n=1 Tax=Eschrichtius robustus TaxID=9764 RepID=A0AB34H562_ESCRO|nr:hypothetical protein J1605_006605 [Eschrichtius robustus]
MDDLTTAVEENRVREMFGSGTACVVCPVSNILYKGETIHIPTMENGPKLASRILDKLTDIQLPSYSPLPLPFGVFSVIQYALLSAASFLPFCIFYSFPT